MAGEKTTGITLQTLDTKRFDHGLILSQTPAPGFDIPDPESCDVPQLLSLVSTKGAEMLVDGIRNRVFVPPLKSAITSSAEDGRVLRHAAKIHTGDRHLDWSIWSWDKIRRHQRVIGPLWNTALVAGDTSAAAKPPQRKRIILTKMRAVDPAFDNVPSSAIEPGLPFVDTRNATKGNEQPLYIFTGEGTLVCIDELKVEGERAAPAYKAALKAKLIQPTTTESPICKFYGLLQ